MVHSISVETFSSLDSGWDGGLFVVPGGYRVTQMMGAGVLSIVVSHQMCSEGILVFFGQFGWSDVMVTEEGGVRIQSGSL